MLHSPMSLFFIYTLGNIKLLFSLSLDLFLVLTVFLQFALYFGYVTLYRKCTAIPAHAQTRA